MAHGGGVNLLRQLRELSKLGHDLYVLSLSEINPEPYQAGIAELGKICQDVCVIQRPKLTSALKATRFLSLGDPPHVRNLVRPEAQRYVRDLTTSGTVDIAYLIHTATGGYLSSVDRLRCATVLEVQDTETRYGQSLLRYERRPWRWLHALITWQRERLYERWLVDQVDRVFSLSLEDQRFILNLNPRAQVTFTPTMIDTREFAPSESEEEQNALVFIGSFSHAPNADAITWFCRQILPLIAVHVPGIHLHIVGRHAVEEVGHLASSLVNVVGLVEDVLPWLAKASVVVAPIRSGGGVRIKNLEALASGRPLVTTSLGAEGLCSIAGNAYLTADDAPGFAEAVISLLRNPERRCLLGRSGRAMIERNHSAEVAGAKLENLLEETIMRHRASH